MNPAPRVRVVPVRWLPMGVAGMTLRHTILVRREHTGDEALLRHEMVHVEQWKDQGVARFLWRYLWDYVSGRLRGLSHQEAYLAIPFEVEARRIAGR